MGSSKKGKKRGGRCAAGVRAYYCAVLFRVCQIDASFRWFSQQAEEEDMLNRLAGKRWYYLDEYSGYNQISIAPEDQEKTTFTCPYGTFEFKRMPFGLCNEPTTFQRCMMSIFSDMVEDTLEVFIDDFSVVGDTFDDYLFNLSRALQRCEKANLVLN
ncbi:RNA-directed DNA polymerase homolog [Solanum tuberosum]|uniref:RNA-directed DNA polymerase homolog n=1 Tax=Solanum tuberosum TaxID=4113 RepID=UPI00073A0552|nr:PREDICTED: RNA-directed DNA polymerase homolog [Solanum tuberosum]